MIIQRVVEMLKQDPAVALLVANRVYPVQWPDAPDFPLIIVEKASGMDEADMNGPAGIAMARVQIDVYSDTGYAAMVKVVIAAKALLHGVGKTGPVESPCAIDSSFCINDSDQPVPDAERAGPRLRRRMLEFRIWTMEA